MNRGAERLREVLKRGDQAKLAKRLGVDPAAVSKWLKGTHTPDAKHRAPIEDEYGIGWRLWDIDVEADDTPDEPEPDGAGADEDTETRAKAAAPSRTGTGE